MVEEGGDSIVINVSCVNSRRDIAVGDVKGWVCVYFGDDCFYMVYVWRVGFGEFDGVMDIGYEPSSSVSSPVFSYCCIVGNVWGL